MASEPPRMLAVSLGVSIDLVDPVHGIVAGCKLSETHAKVSTMPEVAVAEDYNSFVTKNDIRAAR